VTRFVADRPLHQRRRVRQHVPPAELLEHARESQRAIAAAEAARDRAFLAAATAGWSLREIGRAVGYSAGSVLRAIERAEARS
jgi:DNA-directed RNA polymerase specialized sigma24 family protein